MADVHFSVSGQDLTLITEGTGSTFWVVWSQVSSGNSAPANMGELKIGPSPNSDDIFEVAINGPTGPGAVNVTSINLDHTSWNGYSLIHTGSSITGNVGAITVHSDGASGGAINGLTVGGNVVGNVTALKGKGLTINGNFGDTGGSTHNMFLGDIDGGDVVIGSAIDAGIAIATGITSDGRLRIKNNTTGLNLLIEAIESGGSVDIGYNQSAGSASMSGTTIQILGGLPSGATLNLDNARNLTGTLTFGGVSPMDIDGNVDVYEFSGTITAANLDGAITIADDFSGTGLSLAGDLTGTLSVGDDLNADVTVADDFSGSLSVTDAITSQITVTDDVTGGLIHSGGAVSGDILLQDDVNDSSGDTIDLDGALSGTVHVGGDVINGTLHLASMSYAGRLEVTGSYAGTANVTSTMAGTIDITGAMSGGEIDVTGAVNG